MNEEISETDDRSSSAKAMDWVSRIMTVSLMMALPPLLGYWIDQKLGTIVLFTVMGLAFGMASGIWSLLKIAKQAEKQLEEPPEGNSKKE